MVYRALDVTRLVSVQERRVGCARVLGCVVGRQRAHLEFYQLERACCGCRVDRCHGRYGLADVAHFVACQRIFIHGDRQHAIGVRTIGAGYDSNDASESRRLGNVEAQDLAMAHGTAEDSADERARVLEICRVARPPGDFLDTVNERNAAPLTCCGCRAR
jgi:hypothetical protein